MPATPLDLKEWNGSCAANELIEISSAIEKDDPEPPAPNPSGTSYAVDIVFVIDITGSMAPILKTAQDMALSLYSELLQSFSALGKSVNAIRMKMIGFKDLYFDDDWLMDTDFLQAPMEIGEFKSFVEGLEASGGGDEPESALEALALAMKSNWTREGTHQRHVIVMLTDASAHPLEEYSWRLSDRVRNEQLNDIRSLDDLADTWHGHMDPRAKRLVIFAPSSLYPWREISENFDHTVLVGSEPGGGLKEADLSTIARGIGISI